MAVYIRDTVDTNNFVNSKCEEAEAHLGLGDIALALGAYQEAAITARRAGLYSRLAEVLVDLIKLEDAPPNAIVSVALAVCGSKPAPTAADAVVSLAGQIGPLLSGLPPNSRGRITRTLFRHALGGCPGAALGAVTQLIAEELLAGLASSESGDLQIFANFIIAFDPKLLSLRQWNVLAEKVATKFTQLVYKPFNDGAGHWTVAIDQRLLATVFELDDTPESFAATLCLATGLCGVGSSFVEALGTTTLPRREATLQVTTRSEFATLIGAEYAPELGELLSVSRATNEAELIPPPMQVIMAYDFELGPNDALSGITGATYLLSRALYELAHHLLKGQVSESALIRRLRPVLFPFYS